MRETTVVGVLITVCNQPPSPVQQTHVSGPPVSHTVLEQLSGWKYLIVFLIAQPPITVIKLSLRALHCFFF